MRGTMTCRQARQFAGDFLIGIVVFLAVLALAVLDTRAASPVPDNFASADGTAKKGLSTLANATIGTLFLQQRSDGSEPVMTAAAHADASVDIQVNGPVARVSVTQHFRNSTGRAVSGIYSFPLPIGAKVDTLSIQIGQRTIKGAIIPRDEALRMERAARDAGRFADLSNQSYADVFTADIDTIGPGEEIELRFTYQEVLRWSDGAYTLHFPLRAAPDVRGFIRHSVKMDGSAKNLFPASADSNPPAANENPVSLQVRLGAEFPIGSVKSANHEIVLRRTGAKDALVSLARARVRLDRDFELTWRAEPAVIPGVTVFEEKVGKNEHILAVLTPPADGTMPAPRPREVIFVLDTSGSMAGMSIAQLKASVLHAIGKLTPRDRFNIVQFKSDSESLFDDAVSVTPESVRVAMDFLEMLQARGSADALSALKLALSHQSKDHDSRIRQVVYVTDGEISKPAEFLSYIAAERGRSRLFMIGIGTATDQALLRRASEIGRGQYKQITVRHKIREQLDRFFSTLERPVLTDLKIQWPSGVHTDSWPDPLPDLYSDDHLLISSQLSTLKGQIAISGMIGDTPWSDEISLALAKPAAGIGRYWAREKIASLDARHFAGQLPSKVNSTIEALALEHGLVSRMTTLVGLDVTPANALNQPLASEQLAIDIPAVRIHEAMAVLSLSGQAVANPDGTGMRHSTDQPSAGVIATSFNPAGSNGLPLRAASQITAQETSRSWALLVMAIVFALMTALTLGLWRHLRQSFAPGRTAKRVT